MTHFSILNESQVKELCHIAKTLVTPKKGILAADESVITLGKYLTSIGVENNEENRRAWRELLFTSGKDMTKYISGVILFNETIDQKSEDGTPFVKVLKDNNIIPGVKVDRGIVPMMGTDGETTTQGLDDLDHRCKEYKKKGCEFTKWRSVFKINTDTPSSLAIMDNVTTIARYASISQQHSLVPIIEPEILSEGNHDLERAQDVTQQVLTAVYKALNDHHVFLEGTLLKPNMVTAGRTATKRYTANDIANATVITLQRAVPMAVPGITFLSGVQSEEEATVNLNAIARHPGKKPWTLTFNYGRGLQLGALKFWCGKDSNVKKSKEEFMKKAKANSLACQGLYEKND